MGQNSETRARSFTDHRLPEKNFTGGRARRRVPSHRRHFVAGLVGVVAASAGCLAGERSETTTVTPTCETVALPQSPDGPSYPSLPETATEQSAAVFASEFETAYQRNEMLTSRSSVSSVFVKQVPVFAANPVDGGAGFVVALRADVAYNGQERASTTGTPEPTVTGDYRVHASYLVTPRRALRVETEGRSPVDPRTRGGVVVACEE